MLIPWKEAPLHSESLKAASVQQLLLSNSALLNEFLITQLKLQLLYSYVRKEDGDLANFEDLV